MSTDPHYNATVPANVPQSLVHDFNIYDYDGRDPFQVINQMHRDNVPELFWSRNNGGHWVALGAEAIAEIAADPTHFSSIRPIVPDSQNLAEPILIPLTSDPPLHAGYRNAVAPLFSPKHIASLEQRLRDYADEVALRIKAQGGCEFMAEFANEMPIVVFLRFLDLPLDDRWKLLDLASMIVKPEEGSHRDDPLENLLEYLRPIIEGRFANPGTDIISQIAGRTIDGRPLAIDEMLRLTTSILLGGLETVTSSLGYITHHLADHPEARRYLIDNPDAIPAAVEEYLRRFPPAVTGRQATDDFEFRQVRVRKRDHVVWSTAMYNLDEKRFSNPMIVDFERKREQHSTFGIGVHFCLGAFLARMELRIFLERWLKHIPNFYVPADATFEHRTGLTMSYKRLPLVINPG